MSDMQAPIRPPAATDAIAADGSRRAARRRGRSALPQRPGGDAAHPRSSRGADGLRAAAKFRALVYKDHFYLGMAHAILLEKLFPETGVRLFSGIALNNASRRHQPARGRSRHQARRQDRLDADAVGRQPHRSNGRTETKTFPKTRAENARSDPAHRARRQRQGQRRHQAGARSDRRGATSFWPAVTCRPPNCCWCSTKRHGAASRR